jgi:hypothetical protein
MKILGAVAGLLFLAGCGSGGETAGQAPSSDRGRTTGPDWGADACKTLTAQAASKAAGLSVATASANSTTRVGDNSVSTCSYSSSDGTLFTVALRYAPEGTMDESIAGLKSQSDMTGPIEDVAAAKGRAFWAPRLKTLTYLPDDQRMISVTPPGVKLGGTSDPDAVLKQRAVALALAAAG